MRMSHPDLPTGVIALMAVALMAAVWRDSRYQRIDNFITFPTAALALILYAQSGSWPEVGASALGLGLGLCLFLPFYVKGGMAAGDVKLMAAMGACLGAPLIFWASMYSLICGAVLALILLFAHGQLGSGLMHMGQQMKAFSLTRVWVPASSIPSKADFIIAQRFPYATAIAGGCLVLALLGSPQGFQG